jgi:phytoene dehydrogenase-like protein
MGTEASQDPDVVVVGGGPNGLTAACVLARAGLGVRLLEAHPTRAGGAVGSEEATLPGFIHDVGAAFFPFGRLSPAFQELDLTAHGVAWNHATYESCHPAPDGSYACIARDASISAQHFGTPQDGQAWKSLALWHAQHEHAILGAILGPFPPLGAALSLFPGGLLKLAAMFTRSGRGLANSLFSSEAARRVLPGLALHVDAGPDDRMGAGLGYVLGLTATTGGYAVPTGGAGTIATALQSILERHGGTVQLGTRVKRVVLDHGRAVGVELEDGTHVRARLGVLANVAAPTLYLGMVDPAQVPMGVLDAMEKFPLGFGTFKMDWALSGPVPWRTPEAAQSAVVHAGDSVDDLARFTAQVRAGQLPDHPYLVIGQQSLVDPTRAPAGEHTLWAYSRVPSNIAGGWEAHRESFADRVEARLEGLAPGFKARIKARRIMAPPDLERMDANLLGGDIGGGSNAWHRQLLFRPVFPYFRYKTPVEGLWLCSSYAHPGAGVHGMCGYNAAKLFLRDVV